MDNNRSVANDIMKASFKMMELFTEIVKNSVVFWLYFIRGLGFLTMIPSVEALMFVSQDVLNSERKKTFKNFKNKYHNTNKKRFFSILIFFFLFYTLFFIIVPISERFSGALIYTIKYVLSVLSIFIIILTLTNPLLKEHFKKIDWSLSVHAFLLMSSFWWTFLMIISLVGIFYFSFKNFIFLVFVSPGISGLAVSFFTLKIMRKINKKYIN